MELDSEDKLIGVDRGRQDMIIACDSGSQSVFKISPSASGSSCQLPGLCNF